MGGRFPPESIARATDCDGHWETMLPWETSGVLIGCTVHTCNAGCLHVCHKQRNKQHTVHRHTVFTKSSRQSGKELRRHLCSRSEWDWVLPRFGSHVRHNNPSTRRREKEKEGKEIPFSCACLCAFLALIRTYFPLCLYSCRAMATTCMILLWIDSKTFSA